MLGGSWLFSGFAFCGGLVLFVCCVLSLISGLDCYGLWFSDSCGDLLVGLICFGGCCVWLDCVCGFCGLLVFAVMWLL